MTYNYYTIFEYGLSIRNLRNEDRAHATINVCKMGPISNEKLRETIWRAKGFHGGHMLFRPYQLMEFGGLHSLKKFRASIALRAMSARRLVKSPTCPKSHHLTRFYRLKVPNSHSVVEKSRILAYSSAGRALEWHSRVLQTKGQRFDPAYLHQNRSQS